MKKLMPGILAIVLVVASSAAGTFSPGGAEEPAHRASGCFYLMATPGKAYYYSRVITSSYTDDELRYSKDGQSFVNGAKQRFVNAVLRQYSDEMLGGNVYTVRNGSDSCDELEEKRLKDIKEKKGIYNAVVREIP